MDGGERSTGGGGSRNGRGAPPAIDVGRLFDRLPPHSPEAEASLLGSMLLDPQRAIPDVMGIVSDAGYFHDWKHAAVFQAMIDVYDSHQSGDLVLINEALRDRGVLDKIGGGEYLVELAGSAPSAANAQYYARLVASKARLRQLIDAAGRVIYDAYHTGDLGLEADREVIDRAESAIFQIAQEDEKSDPQRLAELLHLELERIEANQGRGITGIPTGFRDIDEKLSGLQAGEMAILAARPSMGKAQPLDARVLTTHGFVRMGDLEVGQSLASIDGAESRVVGVYPQGERQVYRVTLSDGRSTEACDEHLWRVSFRGWDEPQIRTTAQLSEMLEKKRYVRRVFIEPFTGEFGDDDGLPLDPWLLGLLIGDGNFKGSRTNPEAGMVRVSAGDRAVVERLASAVGQMGLKLNPLDGVDYRVVRDRETSSTVATRANPLKEALKELELWNRGADQKFIPAPYLIASRESRRQLLAGLIDADGWVESLGPIRFSSASRQLSEDVVGLMRSLGGSGSWTRKRTFYTYAGRKREGLPAYICNLQHPNPASLGFIGGKGARVAAGRERQRRLNVVSIEPTRIATTQCIEVSHPSGLYVTDHYIVTHNTALALNLAEQISLGGRLPASVGPGDGGEGIPVGFFSLEMSKSAVVQRLICAHAGLDSQRLRTGMLGEGEMRQAMEACEVLADAPLFVDDMPALTVMQLRARARRMVAQHGVKVLFVDYLQLLTAPGVSRESRQVEVSAISRGIKALARELEVPVVCLSQLNRNPESRDGRGHRPRMSDLRESGSIEQDADVVMLLHREDYYHRGEPEWDPGSPHFDTANEDKIGTAELIIAKQRNGPTGTVRLTWDDRSTRFKPHSRHGGPAQDDIAAREGPSWAGGAGRGGAGGGGYPEPKPGSAEPSQGGFDEDDVGGVPF